MDMIYGRGIVTANPYAGLEGMSEVLIEDLNIRGRTYASGNQPMYMSQQTARDYFSKIQLGELFKDNKPDYMKLGKTSLADEFDISKKPITYHHNPLLDMLRGHI